MEERPVVRGRIVQGTSSKRKRRRCNTTRASISGYSSGKLCRNTFSARWLTPTKPEVGSCTSLPKTDRKSTRLNSSHLGISYAVFCLKKKKQKNPQPSNTKQAAYYIIMWANSPQQ